MNPSEITFVVLTKDEASRIAGCLASIPSGGNALVYDSQSADGTADLARAAGARVVDAPWRGFAQSRLDAAALVTTPWTFMLDADEIITPELSLELTALDAAPQTVAYSLPRRNYFCGAWIRGAGWWPDRLVRLFRTGHATLAARHGGDAAVHEVWVPDGPCGELASPLEHHSYESLAQYRTKFERYTDLEASASPANAGRLVVESTIFPLRFAWLLLARGAILDGWRGIYIAWCSSLYPVAVAAKAMRSSNAGGSA